MKQGFSHERKFARKTNKPRLYVSVDVSLTYPTTSAQARDLYTAHIKVMANRVNTVTGVKYKDDPTIMSCAFLGNMHMIVPCISLLMSISAWQHFIRLWKARNHCCELQVESHK